MKRVEELDGCRWLGLGAGLALLVACAEPPPESEALLGVGTNALVGDFVISNDHRNALVEDLRAAAVREARESHVHGASRFSLSDVADALARTPLTRSPNPGVLLPPDAEARRDLEREQRAVLEGPTETPAPPDPETAVDSTTERPDEPQLSCADELTFPDPPPRLPGPRAPAGERVGPIGAEVVTRPEPVPFQTIAETGPAPDLLQRQDASRVEAARNLLAELAQEFSPPHAERIAGEHIARCTPERGCAFDEGVPLDRTIIAELTEAGQLDP